MSKFKEILEKLKEGESLPLEVTVDRWGEDVPSRILTLKGQFLEEKLSCWESAQQGMGECQCTSHPTWSSIPLSDAEALTAIIVVVAHRMADTKNFLHVPSWVDIVIEEERHRILSSDN